MSIKHSLASKARWADISPKERSKRMSEIATTRQEKLTTKQKRKNAMIMVEAKRKKALSK